jgi:hypothetical protein
MTYDVPALPAGTYSFRCDVHPDMSGELAVGRHECGERVLVAGSNGGQQGTPSPRPQRRAGPHACSTLRSTCQG